MEFAKVEDKIYASEYNGYQTLKFEVGNKKPFALGKSKLSVIVDNIEQVKEFLKE